MATAGPPQQSSQAAETQVQSSFPLPPMTYINRYTDDNVQRGMSPKPPLPPSGSYTMFGQECHQDDLIIRPLETQGLQRLHPLVYDGRKELKKLSVSILCNFLDLLDILVNATTSSERDRKIEDLNLLFIHMHHLINEFRPHQARETLKVMMEMQQAQMLDVGEKLWRRMEKAGDILSECSSQLAAMQAKAANSKLALLDEEPMSADLILTSSSSMGSNKAGTSSTRNIDTDGLLAEIFEKDQILSGLINDLPG